MTNDRKIEKSRLERDVDHLGKAMLGSILIVVLGLIAETLLEFIPGTPIWKLIIAHRMGAILVTLGVAGELAIEFLHGRKESRLREINESIITEAEQRIAELNLLAEQERIARVKLEAKLADRIITPEQSIWFKEQLGHFAGVRLLAVTNPDDKEAVTLTGQLMDALRNAGWDVHLGGKGGIGLLGISLTIRGEISGIDACGYWSLLHVLNSLGLQTASEVTGTTSSKPDMTPSAIIMMAVGRRV